MTDFRPPSAVAATPAAAPEIALAHFEARLSYETDCWDTHDALAKGATDFVLLDVRGPALYEEGHVPGAINLPHGKITERRMAEWPDGTLFVVYCAGPHCNGANRAAIRLARLGRPVKEMIGGITGWCDEGFALAKGKRPVERRRHRGWSGDELIRRSADADQKKAWRPVWARPRISACTSWVPS